MKRAQWKGTPTCRHEGASGPGYQTITEGSKTNLGNLQRMRSRDRSGRRALWRLGPAICTALWGLAAAASCAAPPEFGNVVNKRFATVSDGPQSAAIVDVADPSDSDVVAQAALQRLSGQRGSQSVIGRQIEVLRDSHRIKLRRDLATPRIVVVSTGGRLQRLDGGFPTRGLGRGSIQDFVYEGWSSEEQSILEDFERGAYAQAVWVYGDPAFTLNQVRVIRDPALSGSSEERLGGYYVVSDPEAGRPAEIHLPPTEDATLMKLQFLHMMLYAFHDRALLYYDSWEDGMARAATVAIIKRINPDFDFLFYTDYYLMQLHDLLNQPALGNSTYFPDSGYDGMLIWRMTQAAAAWLKCYTENRDFFRLFNAAYYQAFANDSGVAGNIPALRGICSGAVPTVEGEDFGDWYERHYALDTSVTYGPKLYVFYVPDYPQDPDVDGYGMFCFVQYYSTESGGDETPYGGVCYPIYWAWDYAYPDLYIGEQYEQVDIFDGFGSVAPLFFLPNDQGNPDAQRITVDFTINTETARVYFPYALSGRESNPNEFFGCLIAADSASMEVTFEGSQPQSTDAVQGGFSLDPTNQLTGLADFSKTQIEYEDAGGKRTIQLNTGFEFYIPLIRGEQAGAPGEELEYTYPAGTHMVSFPIDPFEGDAARALGIPAGELMLARWRPDILDADKYEYYPETPAIRPGRGFWLKLDKETTVALKGYVPDNAAEYRIGLLPGWNQVGPPVDGSYDTGDLVVETGNGDALFFEEAVLSGVVGQFTTLSGGDYQIASSLDSWTSYWIRCYSDSGAVLIFQPTAARRTTRGAEGGDRSRSEESGDWRLKIAASIDTGERASGWVGQADGAGPGLDPLLDAERPPGFKKAAGLSFTHDDWGDFSGSYLSDIRGLRQGACEWEFELSAGAPDARVVLAWPQISKLPDDLSLVLTDEHSGKRVSMRRASRYAFNSGKDGVRRFKIAATRGTGAGLLIDAVDARAVRGGTEIAFVTNRDADVSVRILSLTGKAVRELETRSAMPAGRSALVWDRRDNSGRLLPRGMYIVEVRGVTDSGDQARGVGTAFLR
jgi:hypothetical protein